MSLWWYYTDGNCWWKRLLPKTLNYFRPKLHSGPLHPMGHLFQHLQVNGQAAGGAQDRGLYFLLFLDHQRKNSSFRSFLINLGSSLGLALVNNQGLWIINFGSYRDPWPKNLTENDKFHTAAKRFGWFMLGVQGTDQGWVDERGQNLTFTNWAENFQTVQNPPRWFLI